jgi:hypothetical protein
MPPGWLREYTHESTRLSVLNRRAYCANMSVAMLKSRVLVCTIIALGLPVSACVVGGGQRIDSLALPSAAELQTIVEGDVGEVPAAATAGVRVDHWTLLDPLPTEIGERPLTGDTPSEQLTRVLARQPGLRASGAMSCIAREFGRFRLEHDGRPTAALREFIIHRCGASVIGTSMRYRTWAVGEAEPSQQQLLDGLGTVTDDGPVGAWIGGDDERRVAVAVLPLAALFLGEPAGAAQWGGFALTVAGVVLLARRA